MRRLLLAIVFVFNGCYVEAEAPEFALSGRVSATDQEADEGYFAIDQATMITVKPGSEFHAYLRRHTGRHVRVTVSAVEPAQ